MAKTDSSTSTTPGGGDSEDLPALVARLGEDVLRLVDSKLSLLRLEIEAEARGYVKSALGLAIAAVVATVGIVLVATALAFAVGHLLPADRFDPLILRALAFGLVGALCVVVGLLVYRKAMSRLSTHASHTRSLLDPSERRDG